MGKWKIFSCYFLEIDYSITAANVLNNFVYPSRGDGDGPSGWSRVVWMTGWVGDIFISDIANIKYGGYNPLLQTTKYFNH